MAKPLIVVPFVPGMLEPQVKDVGEQVGADFVLMEGATSYWDMFERLWTGEPDFISIEQDTLGSAELIESMAACDGAWCSATYGRWSWDNVIGGVAGIGVLGTDGSLGLMRFGAIRQQVPDAIERSLRITPARAFDDLCGSLIRVLRDEEGISVCLHFPPARHLDRNGPRYPDPWTEDRYLAEVAARANLKARRPTSRC